MLRGDHVLGWGTKDGHREGRGARKRRNETVGLKQDPEQIDISIEGKRHESSGHGCRKK